jgi:DNA-binding GntR family transcriptional regulator
MATTQKAKKKTGDNSLPAFVATQILDLITRGAFAPGLQLRQVDLALQFKASRVPVREALKLLTADGVVEHDPNRGFFVSPLSSEEARQLYKMRHLMERELLQSVEWPSKPQLADFEKQVNRLAVMMKSGKRWEWAEHHREFYRSVFDLSNQKVILREVLRLLRLTDRYRSLGPRPTGEDQQVTPERHLLKALAARDRQKLIAVFEADRMRIEEQLLGSLFARGM